MGTLEVTFFGSADEGCVGVVDESNGTIEVGFDLGDPARIAEGGEMGGAVSNGGAVIIDNAGSGDCDGGGGSGLGFLGQVEESGDEVIRAAAGFEAAGGFERFREGIVDDPGGLDPGAADVEDEVGVGRWIFHLRTVMGIGGLGQSADEGMSRSIFWSPFGSCSILSHEVLVVSCVGFLPFV